MATKSCSGMPLDGARRIPSSITAIASSISAAKGLAVLATKTRAGALPSFSC